MSLLLELQTTLWLTAGLLLESYVLIGQEIKTKKAIFITAGCLAFASVCLFVSSEEGLMFIGTNDELGPHLLAFAFMFSVLFGTFFKKSILKVLNEQTLIVFSLLFLYFYTQNHSLFHFPGYLFLSISLVATINGLVNWRLGKFFKIFLYVWYLCIIVFLAITQFASQGLYLMLVNAPMKGITTLLIGMAFLYIVVHVVYLFQLIPLPNKHKNFRETIQEWKDHLNLLTSKFSNTQIRPIHTVSIVLGVGFVLWLNFHLHFVSDAILSSMIIVAVSLLASREAGIASNVRH